MGDSILLDREGLIKAGIDIAWAKDVKAWVQNTSGRAEFLIMYLLNDRIKTLAGNSDEVKQQIAALKEHRDEHDS